MELTVCSRICFRVIWEQTLTMQLLKCNKKRNKLFKFKNKKLKEKIRFLELKKKKMKQDQEADHMIASKNKLRIKKEIWRRYFKVIQNYIKTN